MSVKRYDPCHPGCSLGLATSPAERLRFAITPPPPLVPVRLYPFACPLRLLIVSVPKRAPSRRLFEGVKFFCTQQELPDPGDRTVSLSDVKLSGTSKVCLYANADSRSRPHASTGSSFRRLETSSELLGELWCEWPYQLIMTRGSV